jgi:hypothetical protein
MTAAATFVCDVCDRELPLEDLYFADELGKICGECDFVTS